jgi:prepilin-type N-terminal cleavage/methylation domain-containing protein
MTPRTVPAHRRRQRGVSLIEVLAALTLFALVAAATTTLSTDTIRRTAQNRQSMTAAFLAQRQMERMRGRDYQNLASEVVNQTIEAKTYRIETTVTRDAPAAGISTVRVRVTWTGQITSASQSSSRQYEITTYYTDITA